MGERYRCRCDQCCGVPLHTWTGAYMYECEARFVARMSYADRNRYLDDVERIRGPQSVRRLRDLVAELPSPQA